MQELHPLATAADCKVRGYWEVHDFLSRKSIVYNDGKGWNGFCTYEYREDDARSMQADPESFRALSADFGVDAGKVFFHNLVVFGADPGSFEVIKGWYGKDAQHIYYTDRVLPDSSSERASILDERMPWLTDGHNLYCRNEKITSMTHLYARDMSRPQSAEIKFNANAFHILARTLGLGETFYATDNNHVYYGISDDCTLSRMIGADPKTLTFFSLEPVTQAGREVPELGGRMVTRYASDKNYVYDFGCPVKGVAAEWYRDGTITPEEGKKLNHSVFAFENPNCAYASNPQKAFSTGVREIAI